MTSLDGLVLEQQAERGDMVVDCEWEREKSVLSGKATGTKWGNRRRRPVAHQDSNRDRPGTRTNNVGIDILGARNAPVHRRRSLNTSINTGVSRISFSVTAFLFLNPWWRHYLSLVLNSHIALRYRTKTVGLLSKACFYYTFSFTRDSWQTS